MRYIHSLKVWHNIAKPKKSLFFWQFVSAIVPSILELVMTIFAANLINSLSVFDYISAKYYLILEGVLLFLCFVFWNINYIMYPKQLKHIYHSTHRQIFNKILSSDNESLKQNSKEKMINTLSTNLITVAEFSNILTQKITYLITALLMLTVIFFYNYVVALLTIAIGVVAYFIYAIINISLAKQSNKLQQSRDDLLENFGDIVDGRNLSSDLNLVSKLQTKYTSSVENITKDYKKEHMLKLFAEKHVFFFWKILVFAITFYLISQIETYSLSLTIYLIITPYLSSTILNFFNFLSVFSDLNLAKISALRLKTILDINEKDVIDYGNNATDDINGSISFTNISYAPDKNNNSSLYGQLYKTSLHIPSDSFVFFEGVKGCGKRAIFYMLRREIRPTTGTITFDTINIYDFDKETYSKNLSYVTRVPYFFNDSILNNLRYITKSNKEIKNVLKFLNIEEDINALPHKIETNLFKNKDVISEYLLYMIGLARCILTQSEIIILYELPIGLSKKELQNIHSVLSKLRKKHTIILFSATNYFPDLLSTHYKVENGKVQKVSHNE